MAAWPSDNLTNTHLDNANDDPALARAELNALLLKVKAMLAGVGDGADELVKRDSSGNAHSITNIPMTTNSGTAFSFSGDGLAAQSDHVYAVEFNTTNTGFFTLNKDGTGALGVYLTHTFSAQGPTVQGHVRAGHIAFLVFRETWWQLLNPAKHNVHFAISNTPGLTSPSPSSWTVALQATGIYRVTHNFGTSQGVVAAGLTDTFNNTPAARCITYNMQPNYFDICLYNASGAAVNIASTEYVKGIYQIG